MPGFATHPEPAIAAMVIARAADFPMRSRPEQLLPGLLQEAIGLVSDGPPSAVPAKACPLRPCIPRNRRRGARRIASRAAWDRAAAIAAIARASGAGPAQPAGGRLACI